MSTYTDHAEISIHREGPGRMGFFTDTTVCIGCKACEVACKQWNDLPSDGSSFRRGGSYDHTTSLGATTWRHVRFIEKLAPSPLEREEAQRALDAGQGGAVPTIPAVGGAQAAASDLPDLIAMAEQRGEPASLNVVQSEGGGVDIAQAVADMDRWIFMSDVCKHCTNAGCMDACPTGALIRTEFETVILQPDICNGCGYCIPACPFGVVDRSSDDGRASKCTLCYDRLEDGLEPACAKSCPTDSIQFGPYDELVETAQRRVATLHERGLSGAYLYGAGDEAERQLAGGLGAFFLLTEPPERYGLPAHADSPIQAHVVPATLAAMGAALAWAAAVAVIVRAPRRWGDGGTAALAATVGAGALETLRRRRT